MFGEGGNDTLITHGSGTQSFDGGDGTDTLVVGTSYLTSLNPDYPNTIDIDLISGDMGQQGNSELRDTITNIENVTYKDFLMFVFLVMKVILLVIQEMTILMVKAEMTIYTTRRWWHYTLRWFRQCLPRWWWGIDTFRVGLQKMDWPKTDDPNNLVNLVYKVNLAEEYAGNDTLVNFENVDYVGEYDSEIIGDENDNVISSGSGDDVLRGGAGNDTLNAGAGNDFLYGEEGDDMLILGGSGTTVFDGGEGMILFMGFTSRETHNYRF